MAAWWSAGRASIPASTARTPAAERARPNRPSPVLHRAAPPYQAFQQTKAPWMGPPGVTALPTGSPRPGLPTAASLASAPQETTDPGTNGPRSSDPGPADSGRTDLPSAHRGMTDPGRNAPGTAGLATADPETTELAEALPGAASSGMTGLERTVRKPASGFLVRTRRLQSEFPPSGSPGPRWRARATSARTALARRALFQTGPLRAAASMASGPGHRSQARRPLETGQRLARKAPHQMAATTVS